MSHRRHFLNRLFAAGGVAGVVPLASQAQTTAAAQAFRFLPNYTRAQTYRSLKQSSYDTTGGNSDRWPIKPGETIEVFRQQGPGVVSHIWYTIAAQSPYHLKELVLRMYWDGIAKPSVEAPIGDFFGLNLGDYAIYESEYLGCSPGRSLNSWFFMPYRKSARMTVTNEGARDVGSFYSNIDFLSVDALPDDILYFHAQYRQATPNPKPGADQPADKNPTGKYNYVYAETRGRGHLMGVTLGVRQNKEFWMGEGDDMIFIDDETKPLIVGTGSEDYFLGSWNFGGRENARAFAHRMYGAPAISLPERTGGRYLCYRFHGDNPVTFTRYLKHTMEHGHANDRNDHFYSCCYWYQSEPYTDLPALPSVDQRLP
ncbi:MAG: glycoside hydrolase family 172 protein [Bryobacteraceae bacterium]|nr:glycoside hydrolase family 172 protein [Bryobacteraceae bacterium]